MCSAPFFSPSSLVANRILVCEIARTSNGLKPSFYELDLCVRALLLDENVGYVPPFIVLFETGKDGERAFLSLFLLLIRVTQVRLVHSSPRASHVPSPWILDSLPKTCGSSTCTDSECIGLWHAEYLRSLHHPSPMVRDVQRPDYRIVCNLWGCEVQMQADPATGQMLLQRCQKCKEVLYCSREHQARCLVFSCPVRYSCTWTTRSYWIGTSINVFARFLLRLGESVLWCRCAHTDICCGIGRSQ